MTFTIETEQETDGRWIAEVLEVPGALACGATRQEAISRAEAIAREVLTASEPSLSSSTMLKVNTHTLAEIPFTSPKGTFAGFDKEISQALGRDPSSTDLWQRHPFDVAILRVPPGKSPYVYHSHSAQWEFYHVISGRAQVRHKDGTTAVETGDAFLFKPDEPHQFLDDGAADLVLYVVADNPVGESTHYPDSNKFSVRSPERRNIRSENLDYWDGEE